jgi:hypothetical protein
MDSKKSGLRILPEILKKEKIEWSAFEEPYWRRRQMESAAKEKNRVQFDRGNKKRLVSRHDRPGILNQLASASEHQLDDAIGRLVKMLETSDPNSAFHFIGNGIDSDLTKPWKEALKWAENDVSREEQLYTISVVVKNSQNTLRDINKLFKDKKITSKQRTAEIRDLCQRFECEPPHEYIPSFCTPIPDIQDTLRVVKASCAYYMDTDPSEDGRRGGSDNGFPWILCMKDLCSIKARALSGWDTFTMPREIRDRMEVHTYWS